MRLQVKNLGRIREADVEIRPFTVFIGENNTNKTWLTYLLYGTFDEKTINGFARSFSKEYLSEDDINKFFNDKIFTWDFNHFVDNKLDMFLTSLCDYFVKNHIESFWGISKTDTSLFKNLSFKIILDDKDKQKMKSLLKKSVIDYTHSNDNIEFQKSTKSLKINIIDLRDKHRDKRLRIILQRRISGIIFLIVNSFIIDSFLFPAERKTLTILYKQLSGEFFRNKIENILSNRVDIGEDEDWLSSVSNEIIGSLSLSSQGLSRPLELFVDFLNNAENNPSFPVNATEEHKVFCRELATIFEKQILQGNIGFSLSDTLHSLKYTISNQSLDLHVTSSMVKVISLLSVYLRNYCVQENTLIIDEPEMNLHPEAIVKLTELLSMFTQRCSLIITTHSPYIIDHLVNLMEAATLTESEQETYQDLFFLKDKNAFISSEKVSVYLFENQVDGTVEVKNILDRENNSINWETFSNVSEKIANVYYQLPTKTQ